MRLLVAWVDLQGLMSLRQVSFFECFAQQLVSVPDYFFQFGCAGTNNKRADQYGGSIEIRVRFALEVNNLLLF